MNCRKLLSIALGIVLIILVCMVLGVLLGVGSRFLMVSDDLGQPSPALSSFERAWLSLYLSGNASALDRASGSRKELVEFKVEEGESAAQVVQRLEELRVVSNGFLLRNYLRYRGLDISIESGTYSLSGSMPPREIADRLQQALPPQTTLIIPEGWRIEQIAEQLSIVTSLDTAQGFLRSAGVQPAGFTFSQDFPEPVWVEGFLFPDTYLIEPDATGEEIVGMMLENFEGRVDQDLRRGFTYQGLSLREAVTLASIVEREAIHPEERPLIAGVFLNRLQAGIKLEADPTVQYALGRQAGGTWWKSPLTAEDLQYDSPYNTYMYPGLPPGPIANPGLSSMGAVAEPENTEFFYFRARCDGSGYHEFAVTFEEHLQNACP
jgi:UPF0755 protein